MAEEKIKKKIDEKIVEIVKNNGVGVLPTDTIYGLVGSALSKKAVERIYKLKKRSANSPFIILISKIKDLKIFGIGDSPGTVPGLSPKRIWPGQVSVILDCSNLPKEMSYLRPLNNTLAFRLPESKWIRNFLKQTGPLVAPSANPENEKPAETVKQAKDYFQNKVDFYVDGGWLAGQPSTLIRLNGNKIEIRRQGAVKIKGKQ
ncbi:MAG: L-threonylcarbamoyladenylate synthase [Patescibacteria group bacterium]|nr:L-threonylcarbamoyladenylate synthase [Patescibacteria group bacterium]